MDEISDSKMEELSDPQPPLASTSFELTELDLEFRTIYNYQMSASGMNSGRFIYQKSQSNKGVEQAAVAVVGSINS